MPRKDGGNSAQDEKGTYQMWKKMATRFLLNLGRLETPLLLLAA